MSSYKEDILKSIIDSKKYSVITEYMNIVFPDVKSKVLVDTYDGDELRIFKNNGDVNMLIPNNMTPVQESSITSALSNGTIFDDADKVDNYAKYIELTTLPYNGMIKNNKDDSNIHVALSSVVGKYDKQPNEEFDVDDTSIENGKNFLSDAFDHTKSNQGMVDIIDNYLGNENSDYSPLGKCARNVESEIESIKDIPIDDCISDDDYEYLKFEDDEPESTYYDKNITETEMFMKKLKEELAKDRDNDIVQEGLITKRPKKLKPIPRDIISYITIEMNSIQDTNDQAMLSGYTCSKLELVDFYLNVIDTNDARYIVPHDRNYLVNMQTQLNRLLTQILRIRPINKNDRVWRVNVNYPEGWNG